ncbi:MAG: phosphate transporter permease subunit PstC [Pseudomonadota bacterium]|jgi:phosphate transport system permease protein
MNSVIVVIVLLALTVVAYQLGLVRSRKFERASVKDLVNGSAPRLHSRPVYHGWLAVLRAAMPALFVYVAWSIFGGDIIGGMVLAQIPADQLPADPLQQKVLLQKLSNLATGFGIVGDALPFERDAAAYMAKITAQGHAITFALMAAVAALGLFWSWKTTGYQTRARNEVERAVQIALIVCSAVAIFTTVGIVLSMLGEALQFFKVVNPTDFFFGTVWNPAFATSGAGSTQGFGMLPLLAGTLLISAIAMAVAIPIGLMSAIFMAEYASAATRSWAKPVIEILAGIPTIVYGFFALVTVGPFLVSVGNILGVDIRATSALTAGVVMGIMIIPFISSLSDDIITQVPRAMRDGSLALGATKSETTVKVVLPAALPGIVGAILLAVSRAIGETMIVVLAAGNSPVLTANPFEAVSTVTVSIVNQLTGDQDFSSAQSLVAFALGLTLFAMTLVLNVIALVIVRRYREQYE